MQIIYVIFRTIRRDAETMFKQYRKLNNIFKHAVVNNRFNYNTNNNNFNSNFPVLEFLPYK